MFSVMRAEVKRSKHPSMRRNAGGGAVCSGRAFCYSALIEGPHKPPGMAGVGQDKPVVGSGTGQLPPASQIGGAAGCDMA